MIIVTAFWVQLKAEQYVVSDAKQLNTLLTKVKAGGIIIWKNGNYTDRKEVDVPIIYADYYFLEALVRLQNIEKAN